MRTPIKNVRVALPGLLAAGAIAATVAGCGGGGGSGYGAVGSGAGRSTTSTHQTAPSTSPAAVANAGIPQHNGGDMDTDNNGAPSDRDGNQ
jgi:hypothetical protein